MTTPIFIEDDPDGWWKSLPAYQVSAIQALLESGLSETDAAALWLSRVGPENNFAFGAGTPGANFLNSVQAEFRKFICGDPTYDDLRRQANEAWTGAKLPMVAAIAAAIGSIVGVAAAVIMPVVALLLAAVVKIGLNAWCNLPPPPSITPTATTP